MPSSPRTLRSRLARLGLALRDLPPDDPAARGACRDDVVPLIARVSERDARARVSLRLVAEALRPDRDRGARQGELHAATRGLVAAIAEYLRDRADGRIARLEPAERAVLAIMRGVPESSPTLQPRRSDLTGERDGRAEADAPQPVEHDPALLREFIDEARDYVEAAEAALLTLEQDPADHDAAQVVMRAFHSIKGTAGFLKLGPIVALAHDAESLLVVSRDAGAPVTARTADLSLRALDVLGTLLQELERAPTRTLTPTASYDELLRELRGLERAAAEPAGPELALRHAGADGGSARVRLDRLDRLVDLVGELVVAQWIVAQDPAVAHRDALTAKITHAGKLVRELHDVSMAMRMVPLRSTCGKLVRLARDLALRTGKQVRCEVTGDATELDRGMVERLADPLMHMVRNAIDHGIETPDERTAAGKPAVGLLRIAASQANGQVSVELSDDGRGLRRDRILARAVERGLVAAGASLGDAEIDRLIFAPGLSTAERLTDVSGRGVGMDVVHRNVRALRGRIDVRSTPGAGATFTLRVPLTLAITDGLVVRVGAERYIVPTNQIILSFRPERGALLTIIGRGEAARLRDEVLPVIRLHDLLGVPDAEHDPAAGVLMVVGAGERRCALLVDAIIGQQQVVAKPVATGLGDVPGLAGAAILGDGRVGLILDVTQLVDIARRGEHVQAVA